MGAADRDARPRSENLLHVERDVEVGNPRPRWDSLTLNLCGGIVPPCALLQQRLDHRGDLGQRVIQILRILAARLGHVRTPAS